MHLTWPVKESMHLNVISPRICFYSPSINPPGCLGTALTPELRERQGHPVAGAEYVAALLAQTPLQLGLRLKLCQPDPGLVGQGTDGGAQGEKGRGGRHLLPNPSLPVCLCASLCPSLWQGCHGIIWKMLHWHRWRSAGGGEGQRAWCLMHVAMAQGSTSQQTSGTVCTVSLEAELPAGSPGPSSIL